MRWAWHMACMGEGRGACSVLVGTPEGSRSLGRPGVDWRIVLKWKPIPMAVRPKAARLLGLRVRFRPEGMVLCLL